MLKIAIVLAITALSACAEIPVCERFSVHVVQNSAGSELAIIDAENVVKMSKMVRGLAEGTCRLDLEPRDVK